MEPNMISPQHIVKPENDIQLQRVAVLVGSGQNFRSVPEPGDYVKRPLMVNAWSQTTCNDFSLLNIIEMREHQSQREKQLEQKIKVLEENLKAHTELLSQIHATSARTSALLGQQPTQNQQYTNNTGYNNNSCYNFSNSRTTQMSPKIVNAINNNHQVSSPAESVKYTIIAENTGNQNDEPIEIQLAEDDGALNLNSSADSGRLEICLAPEESVEIKTENNTANSTMTIPHESTAIIPDATPTEHHFIKKRKLAAEHELLSINSSNCEINETISSFNHMQQKLPSKKRRISDNSLLKSTKIQNNNNGDLSVQTTPIHNMVTLPTNKNNFSHQNANGGASQVDMENDDVMVSIGPNNTRIPAKLYENMNWTSASIATRKLLMTIFDRKVLATHSMTGKPSPAFKDHGKPIKQMLDPLVIADIIFAVTRKCNVSDKEVRNAITTKCADENKMMKLQMNKRAPMREMNKENLVGELKTA